MEIAEKPLLRMPAGGGELVVVAVGCNGGRVAQVDRDWIEFMSAGKARSAGSCRAAPALAACAGETVYPQAQIAYCKGEEIDKGLTTLNTYMGPLEAPKSPH
jgi:hypothetical protein